MKSRSMMKRVEMLNADRLKEIEVKWRHSRMDYTDSTWLIFRIHELEAREKKLMEALRNSDCNCKWRRGIKTSERYYTCEKCEVLKELGLEGDK